MHETKHASELLKSKGEFETFAARYNIKIKSYRADNGVYAASTFKIACDTLHQKLSFCAVGLHQQNGKAERSIGMIQTTARTILLHAAAYWPTVVNDSFWPFAVRHAVNVHNCSKSTTKRSTPWELFTGESPPWSPTDFHVFGCPTYVLHKELQDGSKRPKWTARSWQGCYVGFSPMHAKSIALVYNPVTTHVTPQYHTVFDENFSSVSGHSLASTSDLMQSLFITSRWASEILHPDSPSAQYFFDDYWETLKDVDPATSIPPTITPGTKRSFDHITPDIPPSSPIPTASTSSPPVISQTQELPRKPIPTEQSTIPRPDDPRETLIPLPMSPSPTAPPKYQYSALLGSTTFQAYKRRLDISGNIYHCPKFIRDPSTTPSHATSTTEPALSDLLHIFQAAIDHGFASVPSSMSPEGDVNPDSLHALQAAMQSTEDVLSQSQMLKATDRADFEKVQVPEIRGLEKLGVFKYHKISSLLKAAQLLNSIWSYHRKRNPTGELLKHKARICTDSSQQKFGIDYWQTYAPVDNWSTVRLVLVLSAILDLKSCQVDFAQAFPQAPLSDPVYLKIPQGWYVDAENNLQKHEDAKHRDRDHYIQLLRNLYGCKQGARNW